MLSNLVPCVTHFHYRLHWEMQCCWWLPSRTWLFPTETDLSQVLKAGKEEDGAEGGRGCERDAAAYRSQWIPTWIIVPQNSLTLTCEQVYSSTTHREHISGCFMQVSLPSHSSLMLTHSIWYESIHKKTPKAYQPNKQDDKASPSALPEHHSTAVTALQWFQPVCSRHQSKKTLTEACKQGAWATLCHTHLPALQLWFPDLQEARKCC